MPTNKINYKLQNFNFWKIFPVIIFMFNPKIDLIPIPGYWQGIRLDDLIILFYSIFFFFQNKGSIYPKMISLNMRGFNWIIFFPYLVFSLIVGKIFGIDVEWINSLRFLEYIALIIILNELDVPKKTIISLIKVYIIVNFVCVLLQYFDLIGAISSRGFAPWGLTDPELAIKPAAEKYHGFLKDVLIPPGGILNNRSPGITGSCVASVDLEADKRLANAFSQISDPEQNIEWAILVEGTNTNITETTSRNHLSDYLDTVIINKTKVIFEQYRFMYGNLRSNDDVIA